MLSQSTDSKAADYGLVGDSVSGYRDGTTYRILYTGFNTNHVMKLRKVVTAQRYEYGIRLLEAVVAMLTKMI